MVIRSKNYTTSQINKFNRHVLDTGYHTITDNSISNFSHQRQNLNETENAQIRSEVPEMEFDHNFLDNLLTKKYVFALKTTNG